MFKQNKNESSDNSNKRPINIQVYEYKIAHSLKPSGNFNLWLIVEGGVVCLGRVGARPQVTF